MNKKIIIRSIIFILGVLTLYVLTRDIPKAQDADEEFVVPLAKQSVVMVDGLNIPVEVADTEQKRIEGLSFRKELPADSGMLFVMPDRDVATYWMKDMEFPLDIVWIDGDKIVNIHHNLPPGGSAPKEVYSSERPVNYVLELNGGFTDSKGIKIGDTIKINNN